MIINAIFVFVKWTAYRINRYISWRVWAFVVAVWYSIFVVIERATFYVHKAFSVDFGA